MMKIHVRLKEEINLSNLNNQSSLLLLSGITYFILIHVRSVLFFFFSALDMYILFIDMGFKTMSNRERKNGRTRRIRRKDDYE
jgi:uncharacterized membrane protein SirB2